MKQAIQALNILSDSINRNCKDVSLLINLEKFVFSIDISNIQPETYSRMMFSIYDLSNNYNLITKTTQHKRTQVHNLSIRLRLISMKMICILMNLMIKNGDMSRLDKEVEIEALETMIISIKLCLRSDVDCLKEVAEYQKFCNKLFMYYCSAEKQQNPRNYNISEDLRLVFFVNKFDILRRTFTEESFKIYEIEKILQMFRWHLEGFQQINEQVKQKSVEFIETVITQITFKLLRQGKSEHFPKIAPFLPQKVRQTIEKLLRGELPISSSGQLGEVYELYCEISVNGMQNISIQLLQNFISKDSIYEQSEIFEVILLTNQPLILQVWFNQTNKRTSRPQNLNLAYECFASLLVTYINHEKLKTPIKTDIEPAEHLNNLVRLCKQVLLNLFREGKDTQLPVEAVLQHITKMMVILVTKMYNYQICKEMFDNLYMVSNKHLLTEIAKTTIVIHLYYDLMSHVPSEETYKKFVKLNGNQKSETIKLLKACYELQKGKVNPDQNMDNMIDIINKKPEFALLFCQPHQKVMLILQLDPKTFHQLNNIFEVYVSLFEENIDNTDNINKIAKHLSDFLQTNEFSKLSISENSAQSLKRCLYKFVQRDPETFALLFLYLSCFTLNFEKIQNQSYGIFFNKYGKILKMLDLVNFYINHEVSCVFKIIIIQSTSKYKRQIIQSKKCSPQAGQIGFLKVSYEKLQIYNKNYSGQQNFDYKKSFQFIKFSMFQIFCMTNRNEEIQQLIDEEEDPKIQQIYANSEYIPRKNKLYLLRKLFRSHMSLIGGSSFVSLKDVKELISLAQTNEEALLYVTSAVQIFGQKGKKFIALLSEENPKLLNLLID